MSEFFENEAEETDRSLSGSDSDVSDVETKRKKKQKESKKKKKRVIVEDDDDDEEEEDDEAKIREEMKDLINDDVEEEEDEESGDDDKKEDSELDEELDDDDIDLIQENLGVKISRKKTLKRIRMVSSDEDSDKDEDQVEEEGRNAIANELFEGDEYEEGEVSSPQKKAEEQQFEDLEASDDESDIDDFIVDDDGRPIAKAKKKKHIIHSDSALQEAQDIFGVDFDFDEFEQYGGEEEDEEEFEEMEEEEMEEEGAEGKQKIKKSKKRSTKRGIFDVFEPSELERGYFTELDNEMRTTDMPERFQLRQIPVKELEDGELEEEAHWIYKQAFTVPPVSQQNFLDQETHGTQYSAYGRRGPSMVNKIQEAVKIMRNQHFEVPFIAFYRKEYVEPDLNINDLWKIWHWDEKWTQLRNRKLNMIRLFEKMQNYQYEENSDPEKVLASNVRPLTEDDIEKLKKVQSLEELRDVYQHFLIYYGGDMPKMKQFEKSQRSGEETDRAEDEAEDKEILKLAPRKSGYTMCVKNKLDEIAQKFGLTPEQFGENLRDNYQRHDVEQYPIEPLEMSKDYVSSQFPTEEDVLLGARHMVAMQIAHDPLVRQCVREAFAERAKVGVTPTKKGQKEIDEAHGCFSMKFIKNKPVKDIKDEQFLKLHLAEVDGLLTVNITIDEESDGRQTYFEEIRQLYYRDEFSHLVQQWNLQRSQALERALAKLLYPQMERELKSKLLAESKEGIIKACCRKLYTWLKVAPYQADQQLEEDYDYDDNNQGLVVLGLAYSSIDRDAASFVTLVDGDGQVTDFLRLECLMFGKNAWRLQDREGKEQDLKKLKAFIVKKKPHVVAITADSRSSLMVIDDIKAIIAELEQEEQMASISVELVDNEVALVYENSTKGQNDFREYPTVLRHAISIARRLQDPLVELAQLCNPDEDILCLKYHPLQDSVAKEDLLNALYLEFVNRVNEVGVDINRTIAFPHTAALLQFVCGLGPRKSSHLLKILKQNNTRLENRTQLVTTCHVGPKVFFNCAGFIKIDTNSLGDSTESYVEVLDGSRVHPETYEWARKMAVDALEYDDTAEDANPAGALEEILESPERLRDLDLDAFAEELERQGYGDKHITLYDIRAELNHRYKDLRTPYRSPTNEERFNMLTKETPETFYVGKLVLVRVIGIAHRKPRGEQLDQANPVRNEETGLWQCPFCNKNDFPELGEVWSHFDAGSCPGSAMGVRCRLDNGVAGFIHIKNLSDKKVINPGERVKVNMTIHARITKIDIDRFQVELSSKSSDLLDKENNWRPPKDLYFDVDSEKEICDKEQEKKKLQARQTYIKRVIAHPSFHNVGYKECEKLLDTIDQGEVIIRPSSKGSDHLTVSWKVSDGILQHIDVLEEGKENAFSLGKSLLINSEEFEDLDEIIARYIQPMAAFSRDVLSFKYFRPSDGGKREILDKLLTEEKKKAPSRIPYFLSASRQYPGKFLISYLPKTKVRHEYVSVQPEGFKYRQQVFHSLNSLVRWFKEHFRDPIPGTPASTRTPMVRSSVYATPSMSIQGVDSGMIQRGTPSSVYNNMSQGTPQHYGSSSNFAGGYSGGYNFPVATPMMTPMMTPASHYAHSIATPVQQQLTTPTPSYQPTPRSAWPGATPRAMTPRAMTPRIMPRTPSYPARTPTHVPHRQTPQARTPQARTPQARTPQAGTAGTDWAKAAEMWARRSHSDGRKPTTPRGQSPRNVQSPMEPTGDSTPLFDER